VDYIHGKGGVTVNRKLFDSKMKLFGDRQEDLAKALGLSLSRLNAKINETDGAEFTQSEITAIKFRYHLTAEEVDAMFFAEKVS
jgi:hypothetical protein